MPGSRTEGIFHCNILGSDHDYFSEGGSSCGINSNTDANGNIDVDTNIDYCYYLISFANKRLGEESSEAKEKLKEALMQLPLYTLTVTGRFKHETKGL